jgi:WXXGXW repeat (2 copies)
MPTLWLTGVAQAQPVTRPASNITPPDTRLVMAPAAPVLPVPSDDPPSAFLSLSTARRAAAVGRTGEAREALERAETRLLDRDLPTAAASVPDNQQAVLAISAARRALAVHERQAAITAIDDAIAAAGRSQPQVAATTPLPRLVAPAAPLAPLPAPQPVITRALLPGHWALHGARYVWVPPETTLRRVQSAAFVPGAYVWRNGAYVWVPTHDAN